MHQVEQHLKVMLHEDARVEFNHSLDDQKRLLDGPDVRILPRNSHFENLKLLKSNASLNDPLGSSVTDSLVKKVVHNLKSYPRNALVLISQRVEYKVDHLKIIPVECDADLIGIELQDEFVDTLPDNVLDVERSLEKDALLYGLLG